MTNAADPQNPEAGPASQDGGQGSRVTRAQASDETTAPSTLVPPPADPAGTVAPEAGEWVDVSGESQTVPQAGGQEPGPRVVAGYEVLGVLGHGAMGVVYKARQRGLNRVVALKMILAGAHAGAHELDRFRTEAESVARIQHPHIVQIHEVGEADGRPYFSLEFVDGGSLARKIAGTPQPPREAAGLVRLLAGAMQHAHQAGIIHRDLKPGNILLKADGTPKIADFGLAKRLEQDGGQTQSGAILGTPNYMAPEQAEGKGSEVGPLADVYSLGAILYEMLTGRPPFRAPTMLETLEQVRSREPVAPTELQPKVPRDLETICLKCLQKDPRKRYADAGALAGDLGRFQNGEPIRARPVGRVERLWRWARRNPRLALLGAGTAVVLVAWAVSMSLLAWELKLQKDSTEQARAEADRNAAVAADNEKKANANAARALENEKKANANADLARQNAALALTRQTAAIQRVLQLGGRMQKKLNCRRLLEDSRPEIRALRDDLLGMLRQETENMAKDVEAAGLTPFARLSAQQLLGALLKNLGQGEEALRQFRRGCDLAEKLARELPDNDKARANYGFMLQRLGEMELELNRDARLAREHFQKGRDLQQQVADRPHGRDYSKQDNQRLLSIADVNLGKATLELGDPAAARNFFQKARDLRTAWSEAEPKNVSARSYLAEAYLWLGIVNGHLDDEKAARAALDEALHICRELTEKFPNDFSFQADLADLLGHDGDAQLRLGQEAESEKTYQLSLEHLRAALAGHPDETSYRLQEVRTEEQLAVAAARTGRREESGKHYREALRLAEELLRVEPNNLTWQTARLRPLAYSGKEAEAARQADALCRQHPKSIPVLVDAARCYAACAGAAADPADRQRYLGKALDALRAAVAAGYKDRVGLTNDPHLAPVRETPDYQTLVKGLPRP
jgi:serine/threonine-protein kinase